MELVIQAFFWNISMAFYIRMVVKQLGSKVAQLVGGAKVGHGAMVAKSDPRRLLSSQELLVRCHPFLSCSPSPATRVPNTDHHDFPPKSIDDLCKDTATIVIRGKARKKTCILRIWLKLLAGFCFKDPKSVTWRATNPRRLRRH